MASPLAVVLYSLMLEYSRIKNEWNVPTPSVMSETQDVNFLEDEDWLEEQNRLDREWYDYEEFGVVLISNGRCMRM